MDEDLPVITESEYNAMFGGTSDDIPTITESEYNQMFAPKPESTWESIVGKGYAPPASIGEALSNFGSNIFNKDVWLGRPSGEVIEPAQAIAGPLSKTLQGMTFGFGDEIAAGGNSVLDFLSGNPTTYDQRLADARGVQANFEEASPLVAGGMEIAGALKLPGVGLASMLGKSLPVAKTLPQALGRTGALTAALAGEGALLSSTYGFGAGQGGLSSRIANAKDAAITGGAVSGVLGAPIAGLGEISALYSDEISKIGKTLLRRSVGARGSDYAKTAKELNYWDIDEGQVQSATKQALDKLEEAGIFGKTREPEKMLANVLTQERKLATDVDSFIREADKAGVKAAPTFDNALTYLAEGKMPADQVEKYLINIENLSDSIKKQGGNKPLYVQQQKIAAGSKFDPQDGAANGFWRAVYQDLQNAVEEVAPDVGPLNSQLRDIKITKPILQRSLGGEESKNWADAIFQRLRTSGAKTIAGPAVAATAMFGFGAGGPAALAAGALGHFATPAGQQQLGNTLKKLATNSGKPLSSFESRIPALSALSQKASQTTPQGYEDPKKTEISRKQSESSSFNSTLDKALTQAEKEIAMKAPQVIEVKRTSSKVSPESFVEKEEGGQKLVAYNPPAKGSGITVSTGVDLGQWSKKDLENAGVSPKTILKVSKYLGAKDATARKLLKEKPLTLTKAEADELDEAVKSDIYGKVETKLQDKGIRLAKLPEEAQAVIKSLAYNFGSSVDEKIPSIWNAILKKDWVKVQELLINTKWKQPELVARRRREAELLSRIA